jgi:hypothetical protein
MTLSANDNVEVFIVSSPWRFSVLTISAVSYGAEAYAIKAGRHIAPRLVLATCWYGRPKPKFVTIRPHAYEGGEVGTDGDEGKIDRWFEVHTSGFSVSQRADPKRKMSRTRNQGNESQLQSIAFDVGQHFSNNFKRTGLKGQLAAPSNQAAIQLKKLFDSFGMVTAEVITPAPETREGEDEVDDDGVRAFWRKMIARYDGEDAYNKTIVEQFKGPGSSTLSLSWTSCLLVSMHPEMRFYAFYAGSRSMAAAGHRLRQPGCPKKKGRRASRLDSLSTSQGC